MLIHVSVTQKDIDTGVHNSAAHCVIHKALERVEPFVGKPFNVFFLTVTLKDERIGSLPAHVVQFMHGWEELQPVFPFEFDWEIDYPITNLEKQ